MLEAVRAHERGHAREWKEGMDMAFAAAKATIEGLSVPHVCKMTAAQAKARLKALSAYRDAIDATDMVALGHYRRLNSQYALDDEAVVAGPMVERIRAKARRAGDWPRACR